MVVSEEAETKEKQLARVARTIALPTWSETPVLVSTSASEIVEVSSILGPKKHSNHMIPFEIMELFPDRPFKIVVVNQVAQ